MKVPKLPLVVKVLIAIVLGVGLGHFVPSWLVRGTNTFTSLFDQLLKFFIPLIILGLVTPAIADVGHSAGRMLLVTVAIAYAFTVLSGLFAYLFSVELFPRVLDTSSLGALEAAGREFQPYFTIGIPPLMDVMTALVLSFVLGLGIAFSDSRRLLAAFDEFKAIIVRSIEKVIIPLLPFYIFGLFLDMTAAGKVGPVLGSFLAVVVIIFVMTLVLLVLQYCIAGAVSRKNPLKLLSGMLPAYMTALGTASSAATIPVTLKCTVKNGVSEGVAGFTVPLCATIHLSGSTLCRRPDADAGHPVRLPDDPGLRPDARSDHGGGPWRAGRGDNGRPWSAWRHTGVRCHAAGADDHPLHRHGQFRYCLQRDRRRRDRGDHRPDFPPGGRFIAALRMTPLPRLQGKWIIRIFAG